METTSGIVLSSMSLNNIKNQITQWSDTAVPVQISSNSLSIDDGSGATSSFDGQVLANTSINSLCWTYPHTYLYYSPYPGSTDQMMVTKAENGFVLAYNGKTYIAKTEIELAKTIVKLTFRKENK